MTVTHHQADRKIYVTTAGFTRDAIELARKHKVELIDGDRLAELLLDHHGVGENRTGEEEIDVGEMLELLEAGIIDIEKVNFVPPADQAAHTASYQRASLRPNASNDASCRAVSAGLW